MQRWPDSSQTCVAGCCEVEAIGAAEVAAAACPTAQSAATCAVRAVRAARIGAEIREGGGCGGGFPAGGAGGAGRGTVVSLASVAIAASGAAVAAAVAVSSVHLGGGGAITATDGGEAARARCERGVGTGAPASMRERRPARPVGPFVLPLPNEVLFFPSREISEGQFGAEMGLDFTF